MMSIFFSSKWWSYTYANCSCPGSKCVYCNHVMALLFEVADYSLHNLPVIPTEVDRVVSVRVVWDNSGFDNCVNLPSLNTKTVSTTYGEFFCGSSLSYQLQPIPFDFEIVTGIEKIESFVYTCGDFVDLRFFVQENDMIPKDWSLDDLERE